jgi:hypothetical protein
VNGHGSFDHHRNIMRFKGRFWQTRFWPNQTWPNQT